MRYTKGMRVEILDKKEVPSGSWKPGAILSGDGRTYRVKHDWPSPGTLIRRSERVPRRLLRPRPPQDSDETDWLPGDVLEVLNLGSWKIAEVLTTVGLSRFSVRILGSSQTLEAASYVLRMRHIWEDERWVSLGKDLDQPLMKGESAEKGLKRGKKRKNGPPAKKPRKNDFAVDFGKAGFSGPINSSACSSSGSNDPHLGSSRQLMDDDHVSENASACCRSTRGDVEDKLHELELGAYRTTLEVLFHSGFVTWDQEAMLTDLRRELRISNDEHISELRHLSSRSS